MLQEQKQAYQHLNANYEDTTGRFTEQERQLIAEFGFIPLGALGLLQDPEHYRATTTFEDVVDFGDTFNQWRNYTVPEDERWTAENKVNLPPDITVLGFDDPSIKARLEQVTDLVAHIYGQEEEKDGYYAEYQKHIDVVMSKMRAHFQSIRKENTFAATLLRGGLRFEKDFPVAPNRRIRTEAKRLDMADGTMKFGLDQWEGLEHIGQEEFKEGIEVVIGDDCISTGGSILAELIALHERFLRGELPRMNKVYVYAIAGEQAGMQNMIEVLEGMGIAVEIMVGDVAYQYSQKFYLERAAGEKRSDGEEYAGQNPWVGDMGDILSYKPENVRK